SGRLHHKPRDRRRNVWTCGGAFGAGLEMNKDYVNLLPWTYRQRCLVRRRLRQWSIVWAAVAAVLVLGWLDWRAGWEAALQEVEVHEQCYDEIRSLKGAIARLLVQKQGLSKQQELVGRLQQSPPPLLPVALVSASAARCEGRVVVNRLVYSESPMKQPVAPAATAPGSTAPVPATAAVATQPLLSGSVTIDGVGADNVAIAEFVLGLRESSAFERVDLKSAAASTTRAGKVTSYQVECGL
ncbi:MAG: PilN domain-containing protein, partial [Pirellulales bacterium]